MIIKEVVARTIKDSRNEKTIEVYVNGHQASSPTGKSTGKYETKPYHDSIDWNVKFLNSWDDEIKITSFGDLKILEDLIKKRAKLKNVKNFGANALFAFESAVLKALAYEQKKELWQIINSKAKKFPMPVGNVVGGGLHSAQFAKHPSFQEFLVIPETKTFSEAVKILRYFYAEIGKKVGAESTNDEGAWHAPLNDQEVFEAMDFVRKDCVKKFRNNINIGVDCAASSFWKDEKYFFSQLGYRYEQYLFLVENFIEKYGLYYVEDPFEQESFKGFSEVLAKNKKLLIVGDDLTASQPERLRKTIKSKSINAMIIKPNQNGSLLEIKELFDICKKNKIKTILSHRSGETMDNALADYAFGFGADYIKAGAATPWREAKLKRMIEVEKRFK